VDEFLDLNHLDMCLAIRAAFTVRDVVKNLNESKLKRVTTLNDIFA
jgi:hypothetical protein